MLRHVEHQVAYADDGPLEILASGVVGLQTCLSCFPTPDLSWRVQHMPIRSFIDARWCVREHRCRNARGRSPVNHKAVPVLLRQQPIRSVICVASNPPAAANPDAPLCAAIVSVTSSASRSALIPCAGVSARRHARDRRINAHSISRPSLPICSRKANLRMVTSRPGRPLPDMHQAVGALVA